MVAVFPITHRKGGAQRAKRESLSGSAHSTANGMPLTIKIREPLLLPLLYRFKAGASAPGQQGTAALNLLSRRGFHQGFSP